MHQFEDRVLTPSPHRGEGFHPPNAAWAPKPDQLMELPITFIDLQPLREYNDHVHFQSVPMVLSDRVYMSMTHKQNPYLTQEVSMHRSLRRNHEHSIYVSDGGVLP